MDPWWSCGAQLLMAPERLPIAEGGKYAIQPNDGWLRQVRRLFSPFPV
jgi:hypothetical protein